MIDNRHSLCRGLETAYGFPSVPLEASIAVINPPVRQFVVLSDDRVRQMLGSSSDGTGVPEDLAPLVRTAPPKTRVRASVISLLGDMPEQEITAVLQSLPGVFPKDSTIEFVFDVEESRVLPGVLIRMLTAITAIRAPLDNRVGASLQIRARARALPTDRPFLEDIVARKAILRPVLLPTGDALDDADIRVISTLAEYGLRVPPLLYHAGQDALQTKALLRQALSASLSSGVGLLPGDMFPWEHPSGRRPARRETFAAVAEAAYRDSYLSEFLLEPIADCEDRLQHAHDSRYVSFLVRPGGLAPFLHVASVARRRDGRAIHSSALLTEPPAGMSPRHTGCDRCTLRELCGGVDGSVREEQARGLCDARDTFFRLFLREAVRVSQTLTQPVPAEATL